ncbi:MAG TPA: hypothetical protein VFM25_08845 [Verrucomicrobiae bacterium]|nr:hypothetical protein [Verrucomicrobiae bacterium]
MMAGENSFEIRRAQGFEIYVLRNSFVEISAVPELGAKIISLKNLRTEREWLWHPPGDLKLFRNESGDDFSKSPLAGIDDCLPTIESCFWRGRRLPCHGEIWRAPFRVDASAWENGILKTRAELKISPFEFERTMELRGNEIQIGYRLKNQSAAEEKFLWAIHPLLKLQTDDRLELPDSTRFLLNGATWVDALDSAIPEKNCAKIFAAPVREGRAAIKNLHTRDRLEFEWDPAENGALGLWLTRGGWHGYHHFAIEPTNAADDSLAAAAAQNRCGKISGNGFASWRICIRVGS